MQQHFRLLIDSKTVDNHKAQAAVEIDAACSTEFAVAMFLEALEHNEEFVPMFEAIAMAWAEKAISQKTQQ